MQKKYIYRGLFFIAIELLVVIRNSMTDFRYFYWYCDFVPIFLALFFFTKNIQAAKGIINIGLFGQAGFILIVLVKIFTGVTIFGYIIDFPLSPAYLIPSIIIHSSTLVALLVTYKIKPEGRSLIYSLFFLIMIYSIVIIFAHRGGAPQENFNYIFRSNLFENFDLYTRSWIGLAFVLVALPTHFFQLGIHHFYLKLTRNKRLLVVQSGRLPSVI